MRFSSAFSSYETVFDYDTKATEIKDIELKMGAPGFWDAPESARKVVDRLKVVKGVVEPLQDLIASAEDLEPLLEMAAEDEGILEEVETEIGRLEKVVDDLELKSLLSGPRDACGAMVTINARDGGTDANDWAEMLLRMYSRWAQRFDYQVELLDRSDNEEAGINSATVLIKGPMAFGYLKGETGVHRLVRISPFNSEGKRQTSFAAVDVSPEIQDEIVVDIPESEVREDTYRASGAGGQHVNKTSSAIRLTHLPTGEVVTCQAERSQHKNRALAWKMLRSKLARIEEEKREAEQAAKYKLQAKTGFGAQIRNYFLHPDQRVKDARTAFNMGNFHAVMDGDIQGFLDSVLRWRAKTGEMQE